MEGVEGAIKPAIETEKPQRPLLVFGQGPVIDKGSRLQAQEVKTDPQNHDINFWSKDLAHAASDLYKHGVVSNIIIMGGKTGGESYGSEALLIGSEMVQQGIPEELVKRDDRSTNTLENLVNVLNEYLDKQGLQEVDILGADYHLPRIRLLMQLFGVQVNTAFSAEQVQKAIAYGKPEWWKEPMHSEVEHKLDIDTAARTPVSSVYAEKALKSYYHAMRGTEQKNIHRRILEENFFTRALLEVPEYWIGYVGRLTNTDRMLRILGRQDSTMLKEKFDIELTQDPDEIRAKLLPYSYEERIVPPIDEWIYQEWSGETKAKLEQMIQQRGQ